MSIKTEQHAISRAYVRYGVLLTPQDLHAIVKLIDSDTSSVLYLGDSGNNTGRYLLMYNEEVFTVIYGYTRKEVITFLPKTNWNKIK